MRNLIAKLKKKFKKNIIRNIEVINNDNDKKYKIWIAEKNNPSDYSRFKITRRWVLCYDKNDELLKQFNIKYFYSCSY